MLQIVLLSPFSVQTSCSLLVGPQCSSLCFAFIAAGCSSLLFSDVNLKKAADTISLFTEGNYLGTQPVGFGKLTIMGELQFLPASHLPCFACQLTRGPAERRDANWMLTALKIPLPISEQNNWESAGPGVFRAPQAFVPLREGRHIPV